MRSEPLAPAPPEEMPKEDPKDEAQLRVLSIMYYVLGGLGLASAIFSAVLIGVLFFMARANNPEGVDQLTTMMLGLAATFVLMGFLSILQVLVGNWLRQRRHRAFILVMACLNLLSFPLGTALGIWTLIVMQRAGIRQSFNE
jgi:uncharacterized Tic20 family protein